MIFLSFLMIDLLPVLVSLSFSPPWRCLSDHSPFGLFIILSNLYCTAGNISANILQVFIKLRIGFIFCRDPRILQLAANAFFLFLCKKPHSYTHKSRKLAGSGHAPKYFLMEFFFIQHLNFIKTLFRHSCCLFPFAPFSFLSTRILDRSQKTLSALDEPCFCYLAKMLTILYSSSMSGNASFRIMPHILSM